MEGMATDFFDTADLEDKSFGADDGTPPWSGLSPQIQGRMLPKRKMSK